LSKSTHCWTSERFPFPADNLGASNIYILRD
jgi:hypothetical protein